MDFVEVNSLANKLKENNILAFNTLFGKYYKNLCLHANDYLFDLEASRDVVQESFLYLWENRNSLPHFDNFESYIYTIVRNKSKNYLKKLINRNKYEAFLIENFNIESCQNHELEIAELEAIVLNKIDSLPPMAKKVFNLKSENKKYKEISTILSISVKTVEWHMTEVRKKIKNTIKNYFKT
jgi:RNA polymerase sigma-70 factor (ECF subfamily)